MDSDLREFSHWRPVPVSLRYCHRCEAPEETLKDKLRKCGGCQIALYCNEACQKAAWSAHRRTCNSSNPLADAEVGKLGYTSANQFRGDLRDFTSCHAFAFKTCAKVAWHIFTDEQQWTEPKWMAVFLLRHVSDVRLHENNPALKFTFDQLKFVDLRPRAGAMELWETVQSMRAEVDGAYGGAAGYLGALVVGFYVDGVKTNTMACYPVFKPQEPAPVPKEVKVPALRDVHNLCLKSVNLAFPLRCAEGRDPVVALPGKLVKVGKQWRWEPILERWEDYRPGKEGQYWFDVAMSEIRTGRSVPELLRLVRQV